MTNLLVKDTVLVLPSLGLPYEGKVPGGEVRLKVMTANEVKLLAGARGSGFQVINNILRRLVVDPPIPLEEFLSSDRLAMLYTIRALAYGPVFGYEVRCTSCGLQYRDEININELDVKYAQDDVFQEPFEAEIDGEVVKFVLPRGRFEKIAEQQAERLVRQQGAAEAGDPYQMYLLAQCLKQWGNREPFPNYQKAYQFLCELPAAKYWEFLDLVEETDFGLPRFVETICPRCSFVDEIPLPISAEFFRPRKTKSRRS